MSPTQKSATSVGPDSMQHTHNILVRPPQQTGCPGVAETDRDRETNEGDDPLNKRHDDTLMKAFSYIKR